MSYGQLLICLTMKTSVPSTIGPHYDGYFEEQPILLDTPRHLHLQNTFFEFLVLRNHIDLLGKRPPSCNFPRKAHMLAKTCHQPINLQDCMDRGISFMVPNLALKHLPILPSVQVRFNVCQKIKSNTKSSCDWL